MLLLLFTTYLKETKGALSDKLAFNFSCKAKSSFFKQRGIKKKRLL